MNDETHGQGAAEDEKAHEQRVFRIFVNSRPKAHKGRRITFEEVVELAKLPLPDNHKYYVTYAEGPQMNPEGELQAGQQVIVREDMTFDVSTTYQS